MPALTKTSSSRPTPPWHPHNRNSPPQQGKGGNAAAAMTPACPKPTKNQSYAEPVQLSRPEYPSQSPTHHADTQISPITLKSSASKTPREKSGWNGGSTAGVSVAAGEECEAAGKVEAIASTELLHLLHHGARQTSEGAANGRTITAQPRPGRRNAYFHPAQCCAQLGNKTVPIRYLGKTGLCAYKRKPPLIDWNSGSYLVAGVGFEPTTFRL